MKLKRVIALMLLLGVNAQVFAQEDAESLIACPEGEWEVEDQTSFEEKLKEAQAARKNLFCVDIDKFGNKPFVAKIYWVELARTPRGHSGYTENLINKEESKSIETQGAHSINVTLPQYYAHLIFEDKNGVELYRTPLNPNKCKRFTVLFNKDDAEAALEMISSYQSKYNALPDAQIIRSWLEPSMEKSIPALQIVEKDTKNIYEEE